VLWTCRRCTTRFAVGLPYCPQCTSTDIEKEDGVPKTTVHGGPSNAAEVGEPPASASAATEAQAASEPTAGSQPAGSLDELTVAELRERLRALDLPTSGTKDELRDRLARAELED